MNNDFYGTCRKCGKSEHDYTKLVKYGVRHYMHPTCFLDAGHTLEELHGWQVGCLPAKLLRERGLMETAARLVAAEHYPVKRRERAKPF